ncbi:MAG: LysR family transcriptional regulator substrate-binding protein [Candidatus Eisenbacteria bacterium]|nr:LysR family transcriptional regulator substrate-binding protein [Candidatus Eisenbacteria bacterium]
MGEGPLSGSLRIGSTDVVMLHRLPPLLRRFRRDHPAVDLRIVIEGSASLATALRAREIELALVTLPLPGAPGPVQPLYQDRLVLVASPGDPLASRKRLTLDAVARAPLLEHKAGSVTRSIVESFFSAHGLVPRVAMEISSPEVLRRLARSGLGIAVLPEASVREEARRGLLKILAVQGWNLTRTSGLLLPPAGPPSRSGRAFVDLLLGSFRGRTGRSGLPAEGSAGGKEKPARLPRRPETT